MSVLDPQSEDAAVLSEQLSLLAGRVHPNLMIGCRAIRAGDELALTPTEAEHLVGAIAPVRRATGAGRIVARALLTQLGSSVNDLPRTASGGVRWPTDFTGSIAHDAEFAVAAVVSTSSLKSIGIDIEPALPLPVELLEFVATPVEQRELRGDLTAARMLFCIKEAVYKATHPCDGVFLEHHDVEVSFAAQVARTRTGLCLRIHSIRQPRFVAVSILSELCQ